MTTPPAHNKYKSCLRYPGGKQRLAKKLISMFPTPGTFQEYREPFFGGGSVFFQMKSNPDYDYLQNVWIGDIFEPVANFWEEVKNFPEDLIEAIDAYKTEHKDDGEVLFEKMKDRYEREIKRLDGKILENHKTNAGAYFFIINRLSFSGLGFSGGYSKLAFEGRFTETNIDAIAKCHEAFESVDELSVTNESYERSLLTPNLDSHQNTVFVYLDPPYDIKSSNLYGNKGNTHSGFDHQKFAEDCKRSPNKWMVTYNDSPAIRDLFMGFANIQEVPVTYNMNSKSKKLVELVITNY
jgi:DNA adenine methylase